MQFVEHDAAQRSEQERGVGAREQERELLRRREQDVGRITTLPAALARRRIARARLDADGQFHLGDRPLQIAGDVDGERLERRDVQGVEAVSIPRAFSLSRKGRGRQAG
jgi:hypothetical protein